MSATAPTRLPAAERRRAIVEVALRVFSSGSYAGTTTAEIARVAGVSEPVLYRHFASKRDLWFACLDVAWAETRAVFEHKLCSLASAGSRPDADGYRSPWKNPTLPNLWIQGVTEAAEDATIQRRVRSHLREVHDVVVDLIKSQQAAGRVPADRDANAEAWILVGGGLLRSFAERLGGVLTPADLEAIGRERRRWLSGSA